MQDPISAAERRWLCALGVMLGCIGVFLISFLSLIVAYGADFLDQFPFMHPGN